MADLKMNQFKETTGIKYFYGEESNGTQSKILFSLINEYLGSKNYRTITDANDIEPHEIGYIDNGGAENYPFNAGYLLHLGSKVNALQFAIDDLGNYLKVRIIIYGNWTNWRSITLT